ncbi:hypothetical protein JCM3765_001838 [Sporobolomyces pararoseus]
MSTELSEDTQIDRLSSLPPELLSTIFDFAHDFEEPLREPLSKTLLPYFRQNLYREIRISSSSSLSKLLATIETTPSLAPLVKDLRLTYDGHTEGSPFESLASEFPALKSLSLPAAQFYKLDSVTLPGLRSLSYSPLVFDTDEIEALSYLTLVRLELKLYDSEIKLSDNFQPSTTMQTLEELTVVGAVSSLDDDEWDVRIGRFVESCPKLRSLKLVDRVWPRFGKFLESLAGGVPLLTKLDLDTSILPERSFCSFTHLYPLFPNLTFLSLGEGTTAPNLASQLRKLSSLSTLRLGPDAHYVFDSAEDLYPLVRASTKPPALKLLLLECFGAAIGHRCDIQDEISQEDVDEQSFKEAWKEPRYFEIIDEGQHRKFLELAEANGVQVKGDIHAAISFEPLWDLEVANRHVLYAYQNRALELLKYVGGSEQAERLPKLDFDKLDPDNLKLVKIDLPEEDWFQLSLE